MSDEQNARPGVVFTLAKDVLIPVLAALVAWAAAGSRADANHAQSAKGYEALASNLNLAVVAIAGLDARLTRIELAQQLVLDLDRAAKIAPASAPARTLARHAAALPKAPPAAKAPASAPLLPAPALKRMPRPVPERLGAF